MAIYDIVNPSDPVTIEAEDREVAQLVCLMLGSGAYALDDEQGEQVLPLFLGDGTFEPWAHEHAFDVQRITDEKRQAIVACLRSAMCADINDRAAITAAVNGDPAALRRYNEAKRSSLNDICGYAHTIADRMGDEQRSHA